MGITDLWKLVSPTTQGQTLTAFALEELQGHVQDQGGLSMITIGVDASAWIYAVCKLQAFRFGHAQSGENPELRTLMYKLVALASAPVHAHFVFDGEDRPSIKRGKRVRATPHWLTQSLQELLHIFGFTWSIAKGEAEADLAFLSRVGKIGAVLTEDSDALLFGAERVLRLMDNVDGTFIVDVYHTRVLSKDPHVPLTTSRLLLWAMLRGGDYNPGGLKGCGRQVSQALLKGDLGDSLMHIMTSAPPAQRLNMLETWRERLRTILVNGTLGRKYPTLAVSVPADFPSIDVMHLYLHPVTSWPDADGSLTLAWPEPTQPDLMRLAKYCKSRLGWLPGRIHEYLRNRVWSLACMRALCELPMPDGSPLLKPSFRIDSNRTRKCEGDVPAYRLTLYAPSFVTAVNQGLQSDGDSSTPLPPWTPSTGKAIVPARIMQVTSPQDVINFMDCHAQLPTECPESRPGCSALVPDWHPRPSAQVAAVADILWPKDEKTSEDKMPLKVCGKDSEGREIIDLTED